MGTSVVTIDSFPFVGETPAGGKSRVRDLPGWLARVTRQIREVKTGRPGSWSSAPLDDGRTITLKSLITYDDAADAAEERRTILAIGANQAEVPLIVTDAAGTLEGAVSVERAEAVPITELMLDVTLVMNLDDPHVRSTTATTTPVPAGTSPTVANPGTAAADLLVTLTTAGTVILSAGGLTLTTAPLPSGAVIDTGACTVKDSTGADLFHLVILPPLWPALPAGGGPVGQLGTANLSVVTYDTYA